MRHLVIISEHVVVKPRHEDDERPKSRRVKTGMIQCKDKDQAVSIADVLQHRCNLQAEPAIQLWQPGGGSVTLDYVAIERLLEEYTSDNSKPARVA